jgi:hypothetical protein
VAYSGVGYQTKQVVNVQRGFGGDDGWNCWLGEWEMMKIYLHLSALRPEMVPLLLFMREKSCFLMTYLDTGVCLLGLFGC